MRSFRHLVIAAGLAMCTIGARARAQDSQQPPSDGSHMGGRMGGGRGMEGMALHGITLTDAQKSQVDSIHTAYRSQFQAMGQPSPDTRSQRHDLMMKESADVRSVLTSDQQTQYDKNIADMRQHMMQHRDGGGQGGPPQ